MQNLHLCPPPWNYPALHISSRFIPRAPDGGIQTQWGFAAGPEFSVRGFTQSPSGPPLRFDHAASASPRLSYQLTGVPGCSSQTSTPSALTKAASSAGVPLRMGNVPKCTGITFFTPSSRAASAACFGSIV